MFEIIISTDKAIQQTQKVIFKSSFMALHGVTYVTLSLYPIKMDITEKNNFFYNIFHCQFKIFFAII